MFSLLKRTGVPHFEGNKLRSRYKAYTENGAKRFRSVTKIINRMIIIIVIKFISREPKRVKAQYVGTCLKNKKKKYPRYNFALFAC